MEEEGQKSTGIYENEYKYYSIVVERIKCINSLLVSKKRFTFCVYMNFTSQIYDSFSFDFIHRNSKTKNKMCEKFQFRQIYISPPSLHI